MLKKKEMQKQTKTKTTKKAPLDLSNFSLEETINHQQRRNLLFPLSPSVPRTVKLDNQLIKNNLESGAQLWQGKMLMIIS